MQIWQCSIDADCDDFETGPVVLRRLLTSVAFDSSRAFAESPHKLLHRDQLLNLRYRRDRDLFDRSIDIRITRLRRKIEVAPSRPQIIKTVRGAGYIFVTRASGSAWPALALLLSATDPISIYALNNPEFDIATQ